MDGWWYHTIILGVTLLTSTLIGLIRFKELDKASKFLVLLVGLNFLAETTSAWGTHHYRQGNIPYNIHGPIDLFIIATYFSILIEDFHRKKLHIFIGCFGFTAAILNVAFLQSFKVLNTNFLGLQSVLVAFMCLYYYYDFLKKDSYSKNLPIHFWFTGLILIYWCVTLFQWVIGFSPAYANTEISVWTYYIIQGVNNIVYACFGILFFYYNKFEISEGD